MIDARTVSNAFVELAKKDCGTLTPMQLLKLVYIAHGMSLGFRGVPLIKNDVEAWKYGPVIPDLYNEIKRYRDKPVGIIATESDDEIQEDDRIIIDFVYKRYKAYNGIQLSHLTHKSGTPWSDVYSDNGRHIKISNDLIENYYQAFIDDLRARSETAQSKAG